MSGQIDFTLIEVSAVGQRTADQRREVPWKQSTSSTAHMRLLIDMQ
ncbi:MAG: hypothetical protein NZM00_12955 [Anaerolinea sp.]|nr:hypothetical protein [Anaerolinea sp.]